MADEKRSFSRRRFLAGSALGAAALTLGARRAAAQAKPTAPIASKSAAPRRDYEIHQAYATDTYGGFADLPVSGGGTGYFRLGQIGDRWTFVTPLGNAFLQKGIMVWQPVTPRVEPNIKLKYGDARTAGFYTPWALIRAARWGINTIGWGVGIYHFPVSFLNQGRTVELLGCGFPMLPNHGVAHGAATRAQNKDPIRVDGLGVKIAAWPPGGFRHPGCRYGRPALHRRRAGSHRQAQERVHGLRHHDVAVAAGDPRSTTRTTSSCTRAGFRSIPAGSPPSRRRSRTPVLPALCTTA